MTIKEMEAICGMSRTNIRFYENEGLIRPQRRENGYREYSEDDARMLLKVKLLRSMDVPLAAVKELAAGSMTLEQALALLDEELDRRQAYQERTRQLMDRMAGEGFETLDPERYLSMLENGEEGWKEDAAPRLNLPWRRYWARMLDLLLCSMVAGRLIVHLLPWWKFGASVLVLLLMLLLEPLTLSLFATTPGKLIFGIRVTDPDGKKLRYNAALERTWGVLWEGMALRIPLLELYFTYRALSDAEEGETLPWEWESELTFVDDKLWRYAVFLAIYGSIWGSSLVQILGGD